MSVTLLSTPDEVSFSADYINAGFACADYLQQEGAASVNRLNIISSPGAPQTILLEYGRNAILMTATATPDNSGTQFPSGTAGGSVTVEDVLPYFKLNPLLNLDFDIQAAANNVLLLQARVKGAGYDLKTYNIVRGVESKVKDNYSVYVKLMVQNAEDISFTEAYSALLVLNDGTNKATAILGDKLHQRLTADINRLGPEIPATSALMCKVSCRKYFFQYGESSGLDPVLTGVQNSPIYTVLHGGFSYQAKGRKSVIGILRPGLIDSDRFLKQGLKSQTVLPDQPQYLYFFNSRVAVHARIAVLKYLDGKTNLQTLLYPITLEHNSKYCFDVSPSIFISKDVYRYEVYLVNDAGDQISEKQSYTVERGYIQFPRFFLNWSSFGALDCRMFQGKGSSALDVTSQKAVRNIKKGDPISRGSTFTFGSKSTSTFKARTGFMKSTLDFLGNTDFFVSDLKFRCISGQLLPIGLTSGKIDLPDDGNNLYAQEFEYQYLFDDDAFSESDVFDRKPGFPNPPEFLSNYKTIYTGTPSFPSINIIQQTLK